MRTGENIFKRKDGRWEARYRKGRDASGKLVYGFCYGKTYSEAKIRMEEAKKSLSAWTPSAKGNDRRPFHCFCDEWLRINQPRLHTSTFVKYQSVLEKHIKPNLGGFYPEELTSQSVSHFSQKLLYEKGLSPKTVKDILLICHSVLEYTRKNYSGRMPEMEFIYPKNVQGKIRVLSVAEQKILT
ncbi:MAG: site-specific integrase, partial [Eubacteriales bacterium]